MSKKRSIEVNYYRWAPKTTLAAKSPHITLTAPYELMLLCETCRLELRGRVEVLHWGAELDVDSLTCQQCGYTMHNREPEAIGRDERRAS